MLRLGSPASSRLPCRCITNASRRASTTARRTRRSISRQARSSSIPSCGTGGAATCRAEPASARSASVAPTRTSCSRKRRGWRARPPAAPGPRLLVLSAKTPEALQARRRSLAEHLSGQPEIDLGDAAYTLAVGRAPMGHRSAFVADDTAAAIELLRRDDGPVPAASASDAGRSRLPVHRSGRPVRRHGRGPLPQRAGVRGRHTGVCRHRR